jgi:hypothetical protein
LAAFGLFSAGMSLEDATLLLLPQPPFPLGFTLTSDILVSVIVIDFIPILSRFCPDFLFVV